MNILELLKADYPTGFAPTLVRRILWQVLSGLDHCHSHGVVHRDIKPENILVNPQTMGVKICDFGFSKVVSAHEPVDMTSYVATRWYRAPELLAGSSTYGPPVDIFAAGCVMAECVDGDPLLPGASDLDQLRLIGQTIGCVPDYLIDTAEINGKLTGSIGPLRRGVPLHDRFSMKLNTRGIQLLGAMLQVQPEDRLSSKSALEHEYFQNIQEGIKWRRSRSSSCRRVSSNIENEERVNGTCLPGNPSGKSFVFSGACYPESIVIKSHFLFGRYSLIRTERPILYVGPSYTKGLYCYYFL